MRWWTPAPFAGRQTVIRAYEAACEAVTEQIAQGAIANGVARSEILPGVDAAFLRTVAPQVCYVLQAISPSNHHAPTTLAQLIRYNA